MSMICNLRRAHPRDAAHLVSNPGLITHYLYGQEPAEYSGGLISRLFGKKPSPPVIPTWADRTEGDEDNLDKTWHGLHFLFTGTAWKGKLPDGYLLHGGTGIGDIDVGYGPARVFDPTMVHSFAEFLRALTEADLAARYDPDRMMALKIYPEIWSADNDEEDADLPYLLDGFATLRDFMSEAAQRNEPVVIWLN